MRDTLSPENRLFPEQTAVPIVDKPFTIEEIRRVLQQVLRALGDWGDGRREEREEEALMEKAPSW